MARMRLEGKGDRIGVQGELSRRLAELLRFEERYHAVTREMAECWIWLLNGSLTFFIWDLFSIGRLKDPFNSHVHYCVYIQ